LQTVSFLLIGVVIVDGFRGTPLSSMNLAGLMTWNLIRPVGLLVLLFAGNLFCMACRSRCHANWRELLESHVLVFSRGASQ
jgi:hypothetical protein